MTKQEVEQKIKEILAKDRRFTGATITVGYTKKNKKEKQK